MLKGFRMQSAMSFIQDKRQMYVKMRTKNMEDNMPRKSSRAITEM